MRFRTVLPMLLASLVLIPQALLAQQADEPAMTLEPHRIFSSHMVLQRDEPITIWGWTTPGESVTVTLGDQQAQTTAGDAGDNGKGRWEATFEPRPASGEGVTLTITSGDETITMEDVVFGDVWVMNGQSNMAFGLGKTMHRDMEAAQGNQPLFRRFGISSNEQPSLQKQIREGAAKPWTVCTPQTAGGFSAIGYSFGSRIQRALNIPIGIIDNARGGASIESLVPAHKFDDDPLAARYKAYTLKRIEAFDREAKIEEKFQRALARAKSRNVPEAKWPKKEDVGLRSWDIPGHSPSDMASCYNGMFGVFKGIGIKGVLFHQGYNNAMGSNCRPKRYRVLMRLMVEGWREDFNSPNLPVGVIGFCAGSIPQNDNNFEIWTNSANGAYIREAQRLGLADVGDPDNTEYMPGHDVQIPGLHPHKKRTHGQRAARWALSEVYDMRVKWAKAKLVSAEPVGDVMVLKFDKPVFPHDKDITLKGFAIAGESGEFYKAYAMSPLKKDVGIWNTAGKSTDATTIHVWSPMVAKPVAVRYAWAASPMGNLYVGGMPWQPLQNFRTDSWDVPESDDPAVSTYDRAKSRAKGAKAIERCEMRKVEEAKRAVEILERLKTLGEKIEIAAEPADS